MNGEVKFFWKIKKILGVGSGGMDVNEELKFL